MTNKLLTQIKNYYHFASISFVIMSQCSNFAPVNLHLVRFMTVMCN